MHLDVMLAQTLLLTRLHRCFQPHRAPSGCMAGPAPGVADLGGCDRRPVGQGHQQGQQEVPSHLPRSTLRGLVRSALRCLVWSGAWVVGRRKHMCHTAYLPHVEETSGRAGTFDRCRYVSCRAPCEPDGLVCRTYAARQENKQLYRNVCQGKQGCDVPDTKEYIFAHSVCASSAGPSSRKLRRRIPARRA